MSSIEIVSWKVAAIDPRPASGTRAAAAAGGITTILNFAFQEKGKALRPALEHELSIAAGKAHIDYGLHLTITDLAVDGVLDEVAAMADAGFTSVKIFTSVGNYQLTEPEILRLLQFQSARLAPGSSSV